MKFLHSNETKVLLVLACVLGVLELGARVFEGKLSKDVNHIRSFPSVAATLKAAPKERLKVLIIGNSLSRDGLDKKLLKTELAKLSGREVELAAMHPDASNISQWYYGYRRYFDQTDSIPDLIFLGTGRSHLLDAPAESDRLSAFYVSLSDLPQLLKEQAGDVEAISKAILARTSLLFAHRARVQPLLFYNLVPGYTETTQTIAVRREPLKVEAESALVPASEHCVTFEELLKTVHAKKSQVMVVAIPMTEPYVLPPCVLESARKENAPVLDAGAAMRFDASHFPDGYHLDASGAAEFTEKLLEVISKNPDLMQALSK
ncbi:MAG: hypothetical protein OJI67_02390 [Prosthecobacter sp.]|nr:hypothetical protein [Prosthecobacter sp.]